MQASVDVVNLQIYQSANNCYCYQFIPYVLVGLFESGSVSLFKFSMGVLDLFSMTLI